MKTAPLTDLLTHLATDLANIQKQLDTQFENDIQQFKTLIAQTPEAARLYLSPLAPKRQIASKQEVVARLQWKQENSSGSSLRIGPQLLNFSADVRFQRSTESDCRLRIVLEQIPLPT